MIDTSTNRRLALVHERRDPDVPGRAPLRRWFERFGTPAAFEAGATLFAAGEAVRSVCLVRAGTVRLCAFGEDGHRQIAEFAQAGAVLGHAEFGEWHLAVEAVGRVALGCVSLARFERAVAGDADVRAGVLCLCAEQIARRDRHLARLAHLPAEARLLAFLEEFEAGAGERAAFATLPMTRREIGDHLGMSLETVSRAFGALRRAGRIETRGSTRYRTRPAAPARPALSPTPAIVEPAAPITPVSASSPG
ncbi:MAG: Crp/Fnr family transcriptional regulator [Paracoccaceae bacterium]